MATIEKVVKMWDIERSGSYLETMVRKGKYVSSESRKIIEIGNCKWAIIKLSEHFWAKDAYYSFEFEKQNKVFLVSFCCKKMFPYDVSRLHKLINELKIDKIKGIPLETEKINGIKLKLEIPANSPPELACHCMEQLIELTQKKVYEFLKKEYDSHTRKAKTN